MPSPLENQLNTIFLDRGHGLQHVDDSSGNAGVHLEVSLTSLGNILAECYESSPNVL